MDQKQTSKKGKKIGKDTCKICGEKIVKKRSMACCIKTKDDCDICLKCAYAIEEALNLEELEEYDDFMAEQVSQKKMDSSHVKEKQDKVKNEIPTKEKVIAELKESIKGQDEVIQRVVNMVYRNRFSKNFELKSNPLLIGKSGTGKTEIITRLCRAVKIPYVIENAPDFSETGYVGREPLEIFTDLYHVCEKNVALTERGLIIIDEIDKVQASKESGKDVSGAGVINPFLSYMSGIKVPIMDKYNTVIDYVNTQNMMFVFMGAFEDSNATKSLYQIREERLGKKKSIGFYSNQPENKIENYQRLFMANDLIEYGFSRQFIGRVSIVELRDLTEKDFKQIMLESNISAYRAYEKEFLSHGVKMICSTILQDHIIKAAIAKNIGIRGIKAVMEETFLPALEEVESQKKGTYQKVVFEDDVVNDPSHYILVRGK